MPCRTSKASLLVLSPVTRSYLQVPYFSFRPCLSFNNPIVVASLPYSLCARISHLRVDCQLYCRYRIVLQLSLAMVSKCLAATVALFVVARAQTNFTTDWNPLGEGCVDTKGFLSCYSDQSSKAASCTSTCAANNPKGSNQYNTCVDACDELWLADNLGCWIQSCWNQVRLQDRVSKS